MKRYEKIVLEAEKGITFEVLEEISGELIIRAININTINVYSTNYVNPPIPEGYKHISGKWNNGFVIERCYDGSQFVWIPVGGLDSNGTLDGEHFTEKFGRRNYMNDKFSKNSFNEILNYEQLESIKKYGGFYISRYNISKNSKGKPQSVKGAVPWVNIDFEEAKKIASTIECNELVKSHLPFGAEYDSVLEWLIETKAKTLAEITEDSTKWGNYNKKKKSKTGSKKEWCANNIYDFAGNVSEWTQESYKELYCVHRGGFYFCGEALENPVAYRFGGYSSNKFDGLGFRATLYIK